MYTRRTFRTSEGTFDRESIVIGPLLCHESGPGEHGVNLTSICISAYHKRGLGFPHLSYVSLALLAFKFKLSSLTTPSTHQTISPTMSTKSILLKNGVVLLHDANDHVEPSRLDILIQHGKISRLGNDIVAPGDAEIVDCSDRIISPGFIDTHHHGWQTQLKGRHADELLLEYMVTGSYY